MLNTSLSAPELSCYIERQMAGLFPDGTACGGDLHLATRDALERLEFCFDRSRGKYSRLVQPAGEIVSKFDHLNTDQYATFLYFVSNCSWKRELATLAAKTYALNKALHGLDVFYEVELPGVFHFQHPVGSVLGRAKYADYFVCYQRVSVGSNLQGEYPAFGPGVVLFGGSAVIGKCFIGANSWLSVNTTVMDETVLGNAVVFGRSPSLITKPTRRNVESQFFNRREAGFQSAMVPGEKQ